MTTMTTKDGRVFEIDHVRDWWSKRRHGWTTLIVWRGSCVVCGEPFYVRTPRSFDPAKTNAFGQKRCKLHKVIFKPGARNA